MRSAWMEAAAYARSDVDFAFLSTAPGWRREMRSAWMDAAAYSWSDVDFAFLSTAPGWWREMRSGWTDAAAYARSDVDFAFLSTALGWRREMRAAWMVAAAHARSDVDFAFLSTAPGWRREILWTRTWTGALARLSVGPNGVTPRTLLPALSVPVTSFPPPPQPSHHAHALTSRGMMMGLPVKGHPLRRVHQLPVAKGTGTTVAAAPTWKRTLPAPSGITSPLEPPRCTVTRRGRVCLIGGDTVEVVAWTPVLAPRTQLTPHPPSSPTHSHPQLPPPTPLHLPLHPTLFTVPCLLRLTPRGQATLGHRPSTNVWYDRPDPPP